jgi:hypothetical protein
MAVDFGNIVGLASVILEYRSGAKYYACCRAWPRNQEASRSITGYTAEAFALQAGPHGSSHHQRSIACWLHIILMSSN